MFKHPKSSKNILLLLMLAALLHAEIIDPGMRQALGINSAPPAGWREYQGVEYRVFVRNIPQPDPVYSQQPAEIETEWKWIGGHWVKETIERKIVAVQTEVGNHREPTSTEPLATEPIINTKETETKNSIIESPSIEFAVKTSTDSQTHTTNSQNVATSTNSNSIKIQTAVSSLTQEGSTSPGSTDSSASGTTTDSSASGNTDSSASGTTTDSSAPGTSQDSPIGSTESAPVEEPVASPAPVEEPVASPAPVEEPVASPAPVEEPVASPAPAQEPVASPAPVEGFVPTEGSLPDMPLVGSGFGTNTEG